MKNSIPFSIMQRHLERLEELAPELVKLDSALDSEINELQNIIKDIGNENLFSHNGFNLHQSNTKLCKYKGKKQEIEKEICKIIDKKKVKEKQLEAEQKALKEQQEKLSTLLAEVQGIKTELSNEFEQAKVEAREENRKKEESRKAKEDRKREEAKKAEEDRKREEAKKAEEDRKAQAKKRKLEKKAAKNRAKRKGQKGGRGKSQRGGRG